MPDYDYIGPRPSIYTEAGGSPVTIGPNERVVAVGAKASAGAAMTIVLTFANLLQSQLITVDKGEAYELDLCGGILGPGTIAFTDAARWTVVTETVGT